MMVNQRVQYLMDEEGNKTAVVVPISDWEKIYAHYEQYTELKDSIITGFKEINSMNEAEREEQSIQSLLDEL